MLDVELFMAVFLVFMAASGEKIDTVRSQNALPEEACWEGVHENTPVLAAYFKEKKGFEVFILGMCIPEERKAKWTNK